MLISKVILYKVPWNSSYKDVIAPEKVLSPSEKIDLLNQFDHALLFSNIGNYSYRNNEWMKITLELRYDYRTIKDYNYLYIEGQLQSQQEFYFIDSVESLNTSSCRLNCTYDVWYNNINEIIENGNSATSIERGHVHRFNNLVFKGQAKNELPLYSKTYSDYNFLWLRFLFPIGNKINTPKVVVGAIEKQIGSAITVNGYGEIYVLLGAFNQRTQEFSKVKVISDENSSALTYLYNERTSEDVSDSLSMVQPLNESTGSDYRSFPLIDTVANVFSSIQLVNTTPFDGVMRVSYEEDNTGLGLIPVIRYSLSDIPFNIVRFDNADDYLCICNSFDDDFDNYVGTPYVNNEGKINSYNKSFFKEHITSYNYKSLVNFSDPIKGNITIENQLLFDPAYYTKPFKEISIQTRSEEFIAPSIIKNDSIEILEKRRGFTPYYYFYVNDKLVNNIPVQSSASSEVIYSSNAYETYINNSGNSFEINKSISNLNTWIKLANSASQTIANVATYKGNDVKGNAIRQGVGLINDTANAVVNVYENELRYQATISDLMNTPSTATGGYGNNITFSDGIILNIKSVIDNDDVKFLKEFIFKYGYINEVSKPINYSRNNFTFVKTSDYNNSSLLLSNDEKNIIKNIFDNGVFINYVDENLKSHNIKFLKNSSEVLNFEKEYISEV